MALWKDQTPAGTEKYKELEDLKHSIEFWEKKSFRGGIRMLVKTTLDKIGDPAADTLSGIAVRVYDKRSELVHNGWLSDTDLHWAVTEAKRIVETVLRSMFLIFSQKA